MIDIGCNYIIDENNQNTYDKAYEYLAKNRYIQVIKFPGKFCNKQELVYALNQWHANGSTFFAHVFRPDTGLDFTDMCFFQVKHTQA